MKDVLIELATQIRGGTLELLHSTPPAWVTWAPAGTSNHILWHAGHALWLQDVLCVQVLTRKSELPNGWAETFGQHCHPVSETRSWPTAHEIAVRLRDQLVRVTDLIRASEAGRWSVDAPRPFGVWEIVSKMIHAWHDEARHQGEMYLLLKLRRAAVTPP